MVWQTSTLNSFGRSCQSTERKFSRAAERLGCSQATVTLRIQGLERILGEKLFDRTYHQVKLSLAGRDILPRVQTIVDQHDMLFDGFWRGKVTGKVRLGIAKDYVQPILSRPTIASRWKQC
ncbi:LysR family transcriptional regulator [Mesorhizobium sp. CN2-181]|uniref:LysR family transcriptional regulator n=1 Tax=Mesorhizobium yinganensis TaxID=3157707 RepID=UPI0032B849A3